MLTTIFGSPVKPSSCQKPCGVGATAAALVDGETGISSQLARSPNAPARQTIRNKVRGLIGMRRVMRPVDGSISKILPDLTPDRAASGTGLAETMAICTCSCRKGNFLIPSAAEEFYACVIAISPP